MLLDLLNEKSRDFQAAFNERVAAFYRQIEERLGLEAGAIGTTHELTEKGVARRKADA